MFCRTEKLGFLVFEILINRARKGFINVRDKCFKLGEQISLEWERTRSSTFWSAHYTELLQLRHLWLDWWIIREQLRNQMQGLLVLERSDLHWFFVPKNLFIKFRHSKTANVRPLRSFLTSRNQSYFYWIEGKYVPFHIQCCV